MRHGLGVDVSPLLGIRAVPGALQLRQRAHDVDRHHAGLGQACDGQVGGQPGVVARGIDHREHLVAFMHRRNGRECQAHAGQGAGDHQRLFAGGFDGGMELRVVPRVDFATAGYVLGVRRGFVDLRDQRAVGTLRHRGGGDDRYFQQGRGLGQRDGIGAQLRNINVLDDLEQTTLVVDQQHGGVSGVNRRLLPIEVCSVT